MNLENFYTLCETELMYKNEKICLSNDVKRVIDECVNNQLLIFEKWDAETFNLGISLYFIYGLLFWDEQNFFHMSPEAESRDIFYKNLILLVNTIPNEFIKFKKLHPWYLNINTSKLAYDCPRVYSNPHMLDAHTTVVFNNATTRKNPKATKKLYSNMITTQWIISHQNREYDKNFLTVLDEDKFTKLEQV